MTESLGNSTQEQELLRPVAQWASTYAREALAVFESRHPGDIRPRQAVQAAQEFAQGKKRGQHLRTAAFDAMKAGKGVDKPSKHAVQAAVLAAAVAYTHTDLQTGLQGVRQAQHILGPIVYAALAAETAANTPEAGDEMLQRAIAGAPAEAGRILRHMPRQPNKGQRIDVLFAQLDAALRASK